MTTTEKFQACIVLALMIGAAIGIFIFFLRNWLMYDDLQAIKKKLGIEEEEK